MSKEMQLEALIKSLKSIKEETPCELAKIRIGQVIEHMEIDLKSLSKKKFKKSA